jgi:hypothetical protein
MAWVWPLIRRVLEAVLIRACQFVPERPRGTCSSILSGPGVHSSATALIDVFAVSVI